MALTITQAKIAFGLRLQVKNSTSGAQYTSVTNPERDAQNSSSVNPFDRVFAAIGVSLLDTVTDQIDLFDLGSYDLGNGAGRDVVGMAHGNALIHFFRIKNDADSTGSLVVDFSISNGWTAWFDDSHTLVPGAEIQGWWPAGLAVTDSTNHLLDLTASGGDLTYELEFLPSQP